MIARIVALLLLALALAACEGTATPPPPSLGVLTYGQTVQGTLNQSENRWIFTGSRDETISIEANFDGPQPSVALLGPEGATVARISTATGRIEKVRLPVDGGYTIVIGAGSGHYALSVRTVTVSFATMPPAGTADQKVIVVGDARLAALGPSGDDVWRLSGQADQVVSIQMNVSSGEIDPKIELYAPDGSLVGRDDNGGGGRDALLSGVKLPVTGTYLLHATGAGRPGEYALSIKAGVLPTSTPATATATPTIGPTPTPSQTPVPVAEVGTQLRLGDTVEREISTPGQVDRFAVFGAARTVISVGMFPTTGSKLVPAFEIYAPDGSQLAQAAAPGAAIAAGLTLPVTGAYIIYPHAATPKGIGGYTLSVGAGLTLRDQVAGEVQPNLLSQRRLERSGDRDVWAINLPANATFGIEVSPLQQGFAPVVDVIAPDGKTLGATNTDPRRLTARIEPLLTTVEGRYQIRISAPSGTRPGEYTVLARIIKVEPTATFQVTLDKTLATTVAQDERYTFSFKGVSGLVVLVEAHGKGTFDPVIELYGPNGRRIAMNDDTRADSGDALIQLALNDGTGAYTVQVHGYAMTGGAFTLHVRAE